MIPAEFLLAFAGYQTIFMWTLWLVWFRPIDRKNGDRSCLIFALCSSFAAIFFAALAVWYSGAA